MAPEGILTAMGALVVAVGTAFFLVRRFGAPPAQGRFVSIDGLRGYLALFVFLHHSRVWYYYLRSGRWEVPPSNLYYHLGQSSVALFFMITGFLFLTKIIDGKSSGVDWGRLYVSRVLRLVPLYLMSMLLLFGIVAGLSHGDLNESLPQIAKELVHWLGFTVLRAPNINGLGETVYIVAGVTWSLPYEWFFYLSLPILALFLRVPPPVPYIALGVLGVAGVSVWAGDKHHFLSFLGGIAAALLLRWVRFRQLAARRLISVFIVACAGLVVTVFPSARDAVPLALLSMIFVFIACGNTLWGVLASPVSRMLGDLAYGIYLLHGIVLFVTFFLCLGSSRSRALSPTEHWLFVIGITPLLVLICFVTFRFVERPAMRSAGPVTAWLRARFRIGSLVTGSAP